MPAPLVGIFVGGAGHRMGGAAKGLLLGPDGTPLIARLRSAVSCALPDAELVLVGHAEPYRSFGIPALDDDPPGVGPIGGLCALLSEAERRQAPYALAIACDLPYLSAELISKLAHVVGPARAHAARQDGKWQPLCARYAPESLAVARAVLGEGRTSLQALFDRIEAAELELTSEELLELRDWDLPADVEPHENA